MSEDKPAPKAKDKWIVKPTINMKYAVTVAFVILVAIVFGSVGYNAAPSHSTVTDTNTVTTTVSVITALYGNYTLSPSSNTNTIFGLSASEVFVYCVVFIIFITILTFVLRRDIY